ncbi:MAG: deoxyguanosinetriphosphate triphosphohydrolase [Planctomycetota bacterium]
MSTGREPEGLASYAARPESSRGRVHEESEHAYRAPYQRDRDRIVHSTAFRRLEYKTQVFVNHEGDHYRTRLTHTLEVAQIARTIARALLLNEDLTEAVALAHDLGHTPFGHSGEEALAELMRDDGGFEHNLHGLRVVDRLEKRYDAFDGLNLTYEVREAFVRHRTAYDAPADPPEEFPATDQVHLEGQAVCAADAIAYNSHDLDDGLVSGLISEEDLGGLALWRAAEDAVATSGEDHPKLRRRAIVRHLINRQVTELIENSRRLIAEAGVESLDDVRSTGGWLVRSGEALEAEKREFQDFLHEHLYRHYRVMQTANKAKKFVRSLFEEFLAHAEDLPDDFRERVDDEGLNRVVCDYIAGMTDRYAQDTYQKLFYPYERM